MHPGEKTKDSLDLVRDDNDELMKLLSMLEYGNPVP